MLNKGENKVLSAERESVSVSTTSSFNVGRFCDTFFTRPGHYHPEYELMLIKGGFGTRMVGDNFEPFQEGDLVLLNGKLPHAWISDPSFMKKSGVDQLEPGGEKLCESIYVQFKKSVFGTSFIEIPELQSVRTVLKLAERGIKILGDMKLEISSMLQKMEDLSAIEQLLELIRIIDLIYNSEYELLASEKYVENQVRFKQKKMTRLHNFVMENYKSELTLNECAAFLKMTPTSFCRYMKKQTNVTFSVYLNYIRINFAQKLLVNTNMAIKEICYECGYTSIAYFNQVFKRLTGISPGEFRAKNT